MLVQQLLKARADVAKLRKRAEQQQQQQQDGDARTERDDGGRAASRKSKQRRRHRRIAPPALYSYAGDDTKRARLSALLAEVHAGAPGAPPGGAPPSGGNSGAAAGVGPATAAALRAAAAALSRVKRDGEAPTDAWRCAACTLANAPAATVCVSCKTPRDPRLRELQERLLRQQLFPGGPRSRQQPPQQRQNQRQPAARRRRQRPRSAGVVPASTMLAPAGWRRRLQRRQRAWSREVGQRVSPPTHSGGQRGRTVGGMSEANPRTPPRNRTP